MSYDREIGFIIDSWIVPQYIKAVREKRFNWKPVWQIVGWFIMLTVGLAALEAWGR